MTDKHIVVEINLVGGFTFHGPFDEVDQANLWVEDNIKHDNWVVSPLNPVLNKPTTNLDIVRVPGVVQSINFVSDPECGATGVLKSLDGVQIKFIIDDVASFLKIVGETRNPMVRHSRGFIPDGEGICELKRGKHNFIFQSWTPFAWGRYVGGI